MAETQGCARPTGARVGQEPTRIRNDHLRYEQGDINDCKSWEKGPRFFSPGLSPGEIYFREIVKLPRKMGAGLFLPR